MLPCSIDLVCGRHKASRCLAPFSPHTASLPVQSGAVARFDFLLLLFAFFFLSDLSAAVPHVGPQSDALFVMDRSSSTLPAFFDEVCCVTGCRGRSYYYYRPADGRHSLALSALLPAGLSHFSDRSLLPSALSRSSE